MSQHLEALAMAQERRSAIASIKAGVARLDRRRGATAVSGMLLSPDEVVGAIPVDALLRSVHQIGLSRAARLLAKAGVTRRLRVREVSPACRERLAKLLAAAGAHPSEIERGQASA